MEKQSQTRARELILVRRTHAAGMEIALVDGRSKDVSRACCLQLAAPLQGIPGSARAGTAESERTLADYRNPT